MKSEGVYSTKSSAWCLFICQTVTKNLMIIRESNWEMAYLVTMGRPEKSFRQFYIYLKKKKKKKILSAISYLMGKVLDT